MSRSAIFGGVLAAFATCSGCAAKSSARPAAGPPGAQGYGQAEGQPSVAAPAAPTPTYASSPPPATPSSEAARTTPSASSTPRPAQPDSAAGGAATSRSVALQSASREIDASQRELEVAGSDCRNACRALGSMDRAAGRLCELSQGDGEAHRCEDAKRRVYTARDRVRTACGTCADGTTVDRAAPIPSR